jgi:hypothetical protein
MRVRASILAGAAALAVTVAVPGISAGSGVGRRRCDRYHSSDDVAARIVARSAETAAETYSTDHAGDYRGISPGVLRAIEPTIPLTARQARREEYGAYLASASGGAGYSLTARGLDGDDYSILRLANGEVERVGRECGKAVHW